MVTTSSWAPLRLPVVRMLWIAVPAGKARTGATRCGLCRDGEDPVDS